MRAGATVLAAAAALLAAAGRPAAAQRGDAAAALDGPRRPLLEAGVFGGGALLPDYPAAGQSHLRPLVLPWLVYRGDLLRSDERGVRGQVYRSADLEFTLNFNGALASRSSDNRAREGMPDLDYLGEVGPSLRWVAWRDAGNRSRLVVETPVRAVFGTDLQRVRFRGVVFAPEVALERGDLLFPGARARVGIGAVFASGLLMDYWYQVRGENARPGRPAYDASGGYLGLRLQYSYRVPVTERLWVTLGGRLESFSGATNAGSPLFRDAFNATVVGGLSFTLYRTDAHVAPGSDPFE
jgi:outer membrane scaffolding protein for murein synthesis (MipA/OmpV family)